LICFCHRPHPPKVGPSTADGLFPGKIILTDGNYQRCAITPAQAGFAISPGLITVVVCEEKHIFFTFIHIYTTTA
jgi:hypothetical protein